MAEVSRSSAAGTAMEGSRMRRMLIVKPVGSKHSIESLLSQLKEEGIRYIYIDPSSLPSHLLDGLITVHGSDAADMHVCSSMDELRRVKDGGRSAGLLVRVKGKSDESLIVDAARQGADFVLVDADDWKIIPLENIIAMLQGMNTKILAYARDAGEVRTLFNVLQVGVDGVILEASDMAGVRQSLVYMQSKEFRLGYAVVREVRDSGVGERVCVDTASMLKVGEGMLIGSRANFMFLMHNEAIGSEFTSPRPFRVNAGAVHCYTLMPDGRTKYLAELEAGDEVLIVSSDGKARDAIVGRVKIETRPMRLVRADIEVDGAREEGSIIVQNAETIRFMGRDGRLVSVTDLKAGDEVLVYAKGSRGRHFGIEVDEFILEK
ncbi:MAG: 3-dehydroquinate synthase II [Candidatus Nitrosocaldus sp.]|nr:3-dehydroquinate synthase II [Candidatus Nitrosocaldus sp.]MDW8276007.1 3-dehydroquinate synthase II [Candidatus Nitrosocaldus sp.]